MDDASYAACDAFFSKAGLADWAEMTCSEIVSMLGKDDPPVFSVSLSQNPERVSLVLDIGVRREPQRSFQNLYVMEGDGNLTKIATGEKQVSVREREMLAYFAQNPQASVAQLCADLGYAPATVNRDIKRLKEQGYLDRSGSRKTGTWEVK